MGINPIRHRKSEDDSGYLPAQPPSLASIGICGFTEGGPGPGLPVFQLAVSGDTTGRVSQEKPVGQVRADDK
eukprot:1408222-Amphidinium_carterae.1